MGVLSFSQVRVLGVHQGHIHVLSDVGALLAEPLIIHAGGALLVCQKGLLMLFVEFLQRNLVEVIGSWLFVGM